MTKKSQFTILSIVLATTFLICAGSALAVNDTMPDLQVNIPGVEFTAADCSDDSCKVPWVSQYIQGIFKYAIGIVGVLASVVLMWGGVIWLTAGGNASRISEAKAWIGASLTGLVLALSSVLLLNTINPDLTSTKSLSISQINNIPSHMSSDPISSALIGTLSADDCADNGKLNDANTKYIKDCAKKCKSTQSTSYHKLVKTKNPLNQDCNFMCYCLGSTCELFTPGMLDGVPQTDKLADGTPCNDRSGYSGQCYNGRCLSSSVPQGDYGPCGVNMEGLCQPYEDKKGFDIMIYVCPGSMWGIDEGAVKCGENTKCCSIPSN